MKTIFSVDVEDWFHILEVASVPDISEWNSLPSRVEGNFEKLLGILSEKNVHVTCFFLGYVGERFPHLVKAAHDHGHEIASHGYAHRLVYSMQPSEFFDDARKSREILENIVQRPVLGYRAPGFSVTKETPWFFDTILEAGYRYDSSVFPAPRQHGGLSNGHYAPYVTETGLIEFPITITTLLGKPLCFFGGGYLRLFPYRVVSEMSRKVLREDRPVIFYIHPREIDPAHPRLPLGLKRAFKSYVNLKTTEQKIRHILHDFEVTSFSQFIIENPSLFGEAIGTESKPLKTIEGKSVSEVA